MDTTAHVSAICRAIGMQEFTTISALSAIAPDAKWLEVGPERHAKVFFYDARRRVTVAPETATMCKPGCGVVPFFSGSTMRVGRIRLAQWIGKQYHSDLRALANKYATPAASRR